MNVSQDLRQVLSLGSLVPETWNTGNFAKEDRSPLDMWGCGFPMSLVSNASSAELSQDHTWETDCQEYFFFKQGLPSWDSPCHWNSFCLTEGLIGKYFSLSFQKNGFFKMQSKKNRFHFYIQSFFLFHFSSSTIIMTKKRATTSL